MSAPINVLTGAPVSTGELGQIATMGVRILALEAEIADDEQKLDEKREQLRTLKENTLPDLMMSVGLADFTLTNGRRLYVDKFYSCGLPKEMPDRIRAFNWLKSNGHEGLIKTSITTEVVRGHSEELEVALMLLSSAGVPFNLKEDVHAMTLKSFVREQYEAGRTVPTDLFRVYIGNRIIIK